MNEPLPLPRRYREKDTYFHPTSHHKKTSDRKPSWMGTDVAAPIGHKGHRRGCGLREGATLVLAPAFRLPLPFFLLLLEL